MRRRKSDSFHSSKEWWNQNPVQQSHPKILTLRNLERYSQCVQWSTFKTRRSRQEGLMRNRSWQCSNAGEQMISGGAANLATMARRRCCWKTDPWKNGRIDVGWICRAAFSSANLGREEGLNENIRCPPYNSAEWMIVLFLYFHRIFGWNGTWFHWQGKWGDHLPANSQFWGIRLLQIFFSKFSLKVKWNLHWTHVVS